MVHVHVQYDTTLSIFFSFWNTVFYGAVFFQFSLLVITHWPYLMSLSSTIHLSMFSPSLLYTMLMSMSQRDWY